MDSDLGEINLYIETDGVIANAIERHSDTASPSSPTGAAWLQAAVAATMARDSEASRPPTPASPVCSVELQH